MRPSPGCWSWESPTFGQNFLHHRRTCILIVYSFFKSFQFIYYCWFFWILKLRYQVIQPWTRVSFFFRGHEIRRLLCHFVDQSETQNDPAVQRANRSYSDFKLRPAVSYLFSIDDPVVPGKGLPNMSRPEEIRIYLFFKFYYRWESTEVLVGLSVITSCNQREVTVYRLLCSLESRFVIVFHVLKSRAQDSSWALNLGNVKSSSFLWMKLGPSFRPISVSSRS